MADKKNINIIFCKKINNVGYNNKGVMLNLNVVIAKGAEKSPEESVAMGLSLANAKILHSALTKALDKIKEQ